MAKRLINFYKETYYQNEQVSWTYSIYIHTFILLYTHPQTIQ